MLTNNKIVKKYLCVLMILFVSSSVIIGCTSQDGKKKHVINKEERSHDEFIEVEGDELVETAFFNFKIEDIQKQNTFQFEDGLYEAGKGKTYLVLQLTIENTFDKDLPMSIRDFVLDFEGNKSKKLLAGYGKSDLKDNDFMENVFTLKKGESITKKVLFLVKEKEEYQLKYTEFYEDEFVGDTYSVKIVPIKE